jgi:hypothetical protein
MPLEQCSRSRPITQAYLLPVRNLTRGHDIPCACEVTRGSATSFVPLRSEWDLVDVRVKECGVNHRGATPVARHFLSAKHMRIVRWHVQPRCFQHVVLGFSRGLHQPIG